LKKVVKFSILALLSVIVSIIIGIFIILWIAKYSAEPTLFLSSGAITFIVIFFVCSRLISKRVEKREALIYIITTYTIGSIVLVMLTIGLLLPFQAPHRESSPIRGMQKWDLSSGSKIAYVHLSNEKGRSLPPVIFLHGGPGVADMDGDASYFGQLTSEGFDVYVFDEVGSGHSSRLKNIRGYTVDRDVADLELIRQKIGAEKVILIGHSYGSEIAAHYMVKYGSHVEKAVFISPGSINPKDTSSSNLLNKLTSAEKWSVYKELFAPRAIMTYGLLQLNPDAAVNFSGDKEMDARYEKLYSKVLPALHAKNKPYGPKISNLGFYVSQASFPAWAKAQPDIRKALLKNDTKALIIKASADYLSWSSAIDYNKALKNSTLVYFRDAGHNVYQDQPKDVMNILKAFLTNRQLPDGEYSDTKPPADYEGVH
jgi:proline iminopeptidase